MLYDADSVKPVITVCEGLYQTVEAGRQFALCNTTTAIDNADGDITAKMKIETYHDHHLFPSNGINDCPKPCSFGPHNLGKTASQSRLNLAGGDGGHLAARDGQIAHR